LSGNIFAESIEVAFAEFFIEVVVELFIEVDVRIFIAKSMIECLATKSAVAAIMVLARS
jgi:hypothetical protein